MKDIVPCQHAGTHPIIFLFRIVRHALNLRAISISHITSGNTCGDLYRSTGYMIYWLIFCSCPARPGGGNLFYNRTDPMHRMS